MFERIFNSFTPPVIGEGIVADESITEIDHIQRKVPLSLLPNGWTIYCGADDRFVVTNGASGLDSWDGLKSSSERALCEALKGTPEGRKLGIES